MLCQSDHERSFISDVARLEYIPKEQSQVAASAYLTAPQSDLQDLPAAS